MKLVKLATGLAVIVGLCLAVVLFTWLTSHRQKPAITSYQECVQAGGRIAESYPEQCFPPDGGTGFTNPNQQLQPY